MSVTSHLMNRGAAPDAASLAASAFDGSVWTSTKATLACLRDKGLDHRRANPRSAAGDEDDLVEQRGVAGVGHGGGSKTGAPEGVA